MKIFCSLFYVHLHLLILNEWNIQQDIGVNIILKTSMERPRVGNQQVQLILQSVALNLAEEEDSNRTSIHFLYLLNPTQGCGGGLEPIPAII